MPAHRVEHAAKPAPCLDVKVPGNDCARDGNSFRGLESAGPASRTARRNPLESTHNLIELIRTGDLTARDRLIRRYLPILTRWAHGRLPAAARDLSETSDLVQTTLMRAFSGIGAFSMEGPNAFFAFLRHVMTNIVRDEIRRSGRRPAHEEIDPDFLEPSPEPLALAVSVEAFAAYEHALATLESEQREAVVMRVELGLPHQEIAHLIGAPSANTARMKVARALVRLAELMRDYRS